MKANSVHKKTISAKAKLHPKKISAVKVLEKSTFGEGLKERNMRENA